MTSDSIVQLAPASRGKGQQEWASADDSTAWYVQYTNKKGHNAFSAFS